MAIFHATEVRRRRLHQGWTLEELARRSGIDPSYLRDFESGLRWLPPSDALRLGRAFAQAAPPETEPELGRLSV